MNEFQCTNHPSSISVTSDDDVISIVLQDGRESSFLSYENLREDCKSKQVWVHGKIRNVMKLNVKKFLKDV